MWERQKRQTLREGWGQVEVCRNFGSSLRRTEETLLKHGGDNIGNRVTWINKEAEKEGGDLTP